MKIRRTGFVFNIWTKRRVMKKLLRNRGLVKRGVLLERGFYKSILSCGLASTRK